VHYCGVVPVDGALQLVMLEEVRTPEPPIRLEALFYEPGSAGQVATELGALGRDLVLAIGASLGSAEPRVCDRLVLERGVAPCPPDPESASLAEAVRELGVFVPDAEAVEGAVAEGAFSVAPVFETNAEAVFCALQGRRLPAKRHPLGVQRRIEALVGDHVLDGGGELWHRRIEEIEAAAAALCAHRYAVGHACWLGSASEGVVVLPGYSLPERFATEGVLPPVERLQLPPSG
jgi:hypothetical protein